MARRVRRGGLAYGAAWPAKAGYGTVRSGGAGEAWPGEASRGLAGLCEARRAR